MLQSTSKYERQRDYVQKSSGFRRYRMFISLEKKELFI
jgi:hypothetical protein